MDFYFLPALVALLLKLSLISGCLRNATNSKLLILLLSTFALQNTIEIGAIASNDASHKQEIFLRAY